MTVKFNNDRLIRALRQQPVDVTPIWIMRQAGRYLPEYRKVREQAGDFMTLCKTPELACEVTLQPVQRFPLDAAILFSDILTIPDAMGLGLSIVENTGPCFSSPVRSKSDIQKLTKPDVETDLRYVMDAVRLISKELDGNVPLIGFAGSPWTIATYMIEGGPSKEFSLVKNLLYEDPVSMHQLLDVLTTTIIDYLNAQIAAGVQVVMLFDSWGGVLSRKTYKEFSLEYMQRIVSNVQTDTQGDKVPVILFTKGGGLWVQDMVTTGCDCIGLDWTVDIGDIRNSTNGSVALQGNLDPAVLYASADTIREEVAAILASFGQGNGHIFNLGHGIHPKIDPDNVAVLVEAVHELSKQYHQ